MLTWFLIGGGCLVVLVFVVLLVGGMMQPAQPSPPPSGAPAMPAPFARTHSLDATPTLPEVADSWVDDLVEDYEECIPAHTAVRRISGLLREPRWMEVSESLETYITYTLAELGDQCQGTEACIEEIDDFIANPPDPEVDYDPPSIRPEDAKAQIQAIARETKDGLTRQVAVVENVVDMVRQSSRSDDAPTRVLALLAEATKECERLLELDDKIGDLMEEAGVY